MGDAGTLLASTLWGAVLLGMVMYLRMRPTTPAPQQAPGGCPPALLNGRKGSPRMGTMGLHWTFCPQTSAGAASADAAVRIPRAIMNLRPLQ